MQPQGMVTTIYETVSGPSFAGLSNKIQAYDNEVNLSQTFYDSVFLLRDDEYE